MKELIFKLGELTAEVKDARADIKELSEMLKTNIEKNEADHIKLNTKISKKLNRPTVKMITIIISIITGIAGVVKGAISYFR